MILPAVNWLKLGNTTACCCAEVPLLIMLLFSLPALTATPIGKLTRVFKPAVELLTEELELVFTLDEVLVAIAELVVATDELVLVLVLLDEEDTAQPFTTP